MTSTAREPLASVVMPVYNSQNYLAHAVGSVLAQSYAHLELLLVDDGSTDKCAAACDEAAASDERVVVLHKPNGGICSARNAGLDAARGVYVAFCDNDDEYLPGLLENNVRLAEDLGVDEVRFLREHLIVQDGEVARREVIGEGATELRVSPNTFAQSYYDLLPLCGGVWTGIYRRELLERCHLRFPEHMTFGCEDVYFNLLVLQQTGNVAVNPHVYYRWCERFEHSTSRKFSTNRLEAIRLCLRKEGEVARAHGIPERDHTRWAAHLVDTYVVRMLQQLSLPMCDLSARQKARELGKLANEEVLRKALRSASVARGAMGQRTRLVMALLKARAYGPLVRLFAANARRTQRVY